MPSIDFATQKTTLWVRVGFLTLVLLLWNTLFAGIYYTLYNENNKSFNLPNDFSDEQDNTLENWFYFAMMTQTTVGYGDYSPRSVDAKRSVCAQVYLFWVIVLMFSILADEKHFFTALIPGLSR